MDTVVLGKTKWKKPKHPKHSKQSNVGTAPRGVGICDVTRLHQNLWGAMNSNRRIFSTFPGLAVSDSPPPLNLIAGCSVTAADTSLAATAAA